MSQPEDAAAAAPAPYKTERYAWYVLSVLVLVYVLNFVDRQIISILANDINRDLGLSLWHRVWGVLFAVRDSAWQAR